MRNRIRAYDTICGAPTSPRLKLPGNRSHRSTIIVHGQPTPTKTPTVLGQSLAKVRSSFRVFFQVFFTKEICRAFFPYLNVSVIAQSIANLLFIILSQRFRIFAIGAGPVC